MAVVPGQAPAGYIDNINTFKLPFNELLAGLSAKQKQFDEADALLEASNVFPQSGYVTGDMRKELMSEYQPKFNELTNALYSTGNVNQAKIKQYAKTLKEDPRYSYIEADFKLKPTIDAAIAEGKLQDAIQTYGDYQGFYNPETKQWTQVKSPTISLGEVYHTVDAAPWQEEYTKWLKEFEPIKKELESDPNYYYEQGPDGKTYMFSRTDKTQIQQVTDEYLDSKLSEGNKKLLKSLHSQKGLKGKTFREHEMKKKTGDYNLSQFFGDMKSLYPLVTYDYSQNTNTITKVGGSGTSGGTDDDKTSPLISKTNLNVATNALLGLDGKPITDPISFVQNVQNFNREDIKQKRTSDALTPLMNIFNPNPNNPQYSFEVNTDDNGNLKVQAKDTQGNLIDKPTAQMAAEMAKVENKLIADNFRADAYQQVINNLMDDYGLDPNLPLLDQIKADEHVAYTNALLELGKVSLSTAKVKAGSSYNIKSDKPYAEGQFYSNEDYLAAANKALQENPEKSNSYIINTIARDNKNSKLPLLLKELNEVKDGIIILEEGAIPLAGTIAKEPLAMATIQANITTALKNPDHYKNGKITLADKKGKLISEDDAKIIIENLPKDDKGNIDIEGELKNKSFLRYDKTDNDYKISVLVTGPDNKQYHLEVGDDLVGNLGAFAAKIDPDFQNFLTQDYAKEFYGQLKETNGTLAYTPVRGNFQTKYKIPVKRSMFNEYNDTGDKAQVLNQGDLYFTLPPIKGTTFQGIPNMIYKVKDHRDLFAFTNEMNQILNTGSLQVPTGRIVGGKQEVMEYTDVNDLIQDRYSGKLEAVPSAKMYKNDLKNIRKEINPNFQ